MGDRCYRIKDAGTVDASDAEDTEGGTDQGDPDGDDGAAEDQDGESGDAAEASENDAAADDAGAASTNESGSDGGCEEGHVLQDGACKDINECFEGTHACQTTATCENTDGGYDCTCPLGYSGGTSGGFACAPRIAVGERAGTGAHKCVLLTDGTVQCWGDNSVGQLGDGTQTTRATPTLVSGLVDVVLISAGERSSCAVLRDGGVRCWGDNTAGQLGDGTTMNRTTPVSVPQLTGVVGVSVGTSHTCVVMKTGAVKCWGGNSKGQLGGGLVSSAPVTSPIAVREVANATSVVAYGSQTCVVLRSGAAQCWGEGFLGDKSVSSSFTPVEVKVPHSVVAISIGPFHACSRHGAGHLYCWGPPALGGNGTTGDDYDPRLVLGTSATAIGIGVYSTCILRADGTMAWWDYEITPATVDGVSQAVAMSAFGTQVCEIHMNGTVSCWTIGNARLTPPVVVRGLDLW
jgi:hypothetical protein